MLRHLPTAGLCTLLMVATACTSAQNGPGVAVGGVATASGKTTLAGAPLGGAAGGIVANSVTPGQCIKRDRNGRRFTAPC
jgi:hypothetical protein